MILKKCFGLILYFASNKSYSVINYKNFEDTDINEKKIYIHQTVKVIECLCNWCILFDSNENDCIIQCKLKTIQCK